jgi:hypothetical protein
MDVRLPREGSELFARALDDAIRSRRVSMGALSRRLRDLGTPVSVSALSSWRAGERRPERVRSLDALDNLEDLLHLPRGHLASRLGPTRRVRPDRAALFEDLVDDGETLREMKQELGLAGEAELDMIGESHEVEVTDDPPGWTVSSTLHWQARTRGARRALAMMRLDHPTDVAPVLTMRCDARIQAQRWDRPSGFALWVVELAQPLEVGQTATTAYRIDVVESEPLRDYWVIAEQSTALSSLQVRWRGRVPTHVELHHDVEQEFRVAVVAAVGAGVHRVETGFGPGGYGFVWSW